MPRLHRRSVPPDAFWNAMADGTRRQILNLLRAGPQTTGEVASRFPMSRIGVMKHLRVLEDAKLVVATPKGRETWHSLNAAALQRGAFAIVDSSAVPQEFFMPQHFPLNAMRIEQEIEIAASPDRVFRALTEDVGAWWDHTHFKDTKRIAIEQWAGGRFFEEGADGASALSAIVHHVDPGKFLEMRGPMGMNGAVEGLMQFTLEPSGAGTRLKLVHKAFGDISEATQAAYTQGWRALLAGNFKTFVETGKRVAH